MTLKIETESGSDTRTVRLTGHLKAENLPQLASLVEDNTRRVVLDLREVNLVDIEAIRFLVRCQRQGVSLQNCTAYIASWIAEEQSREP